MTLDASSKIGYNALNESVPGAGNRPMGVECILMVTAQQQVRIAAVYRPTVTKQHIANLLPVGDDLCLAELRSHGRCDSDDLASDGGPEAPFGVAVESRLMVSANYLALR
jgi:hypothetical protein